MQMEAVQKMPIFTRKNSLECNCEKNTKNRKFYTVCDICSEKKFLRKSSNIKFDQNKISPLNN
jgi:hypothetical protein